MTKKSILFLLLLVVGGAVSQAQSPSPGQLKRARVAAFEWVRNYNVARDGNFNNRRDRSEFRECFSNGNDSVFLDYIPYASYPFQSPYTTVDDYIKIRRDSTMRYNIKYSSSNYAIVSERQEGDSIIIIEISWEETITYLPSLRIDKTLRYPDFTFKLIATLQYNYVNQNQEEVAVARSIQLDQQPILPFVIFHSGEYNVMTSLADIQQIVARDNRMFTRTSERQHPEDEKFYFEEFDTLTHRFGIEGAYADGPLQLDYRHNVRYGEAYASAVAYSIGVNFYHQWGYKGRSRLGFEIAPLFRLVDYQYGFNYYEAVAHVIDPDGGDYERRVTATGYNEHLLTTAVSLPIDLRYDILIPSINTSIFGRLGVSLGYAIQRNAHAVADQFHVSGYYDWLYQVELDMNGIYDFGTTQDKNFSGTQNTISSIMLEGLAGLGVAYWPTVGFSFELSVNYTPLLYQETNTSSDYHLSGDTDSWTAAANDIDLFRHHLVHFMLQINYHF